MISEIFVQFTYQLELSQEFVVISHFSFSLENFDLHLGLPIGRSGEYLSVKQKLMLITIYYCVTSQETAARETTIHTVYYCTCICLYKNIQIWMCWAVLFTKEEKQKFCFESNFIYKNPEITKTSKHMTAGNNHVLTLIVPVWTLWREQCYIVIL